MEGTDHAANHFTESQAMNRHARELEKYRQANPWIVVNVENAQALSGRFPTREEAIVEADRRGGAIEICETSRTVLFSEMAQL